MEVVELLLKAKANVESKDRVCTSSSHWKGPCFSSHFSQILKLFFHITLTSCFNYHLIHVPFDIQ